MMLPRSRMIGAAARRRAAVARSALVGASAGAATSSSGAGLASQQRHCNVRFQLSIARGHVASVHTTSSTEFSLASPSASASSSSSPSSSSSSSTLLGTASSSEKRQPATARAPRLHNTYNTFASPDTILPTPLPPAVRIDRQFNEARRHRSRNLGKPSKDNKAFFPSSKPNSSATDNYADSRSLFADETFFVNPQQQESLAILRACLRTGLANRARKIFDHLREEEADRLSMFPDLSQSSSTRLQNVSPQPSLGSVLDSKIYNDMIGAYFQKALHEESLDQSGEWAKRAWNLFNELEHADSQSSSATQGLGTTAETFALMAIGAVKLHHAGKGSAGLRDVSHLLISLRRSRVDVLDMVQAAPFASASPLSPSRIPSFALELTGDAQAVLASLITAASNMGDGAMLDQLQKATKALAKDAQEEAERRREEDPDVSSALEKKLAAPNLEPVRPTKRQIAAGGLPEDEISFNLKKLQENLSVVYTAQGVGADPYERQRALEFGALTAARERFQHNSEALESIGLGSVNKLQRRTVQGWMWKWFLVLQDALAKDIQRIRDLGEEKAGKEAAMVPFLCMISPDKLALLGIMEVMRLQGSNEVIEGAKTARVVTSVGRAIEDECYSIQVKELTKNFDRFKDISQILKRRGVTDFQTRIEMKRILKQQESEGKQVSKEAWTISMRALVGSFVTQHLMNVATITRSGTDRDGVEWVDEQPAFYSTYHYVQGKRVGLIKLNNAVQEVLGQVGAPETLQPRNLPMLVPPRPWLTYDSGGYYSIRSYALRTKNSIEQSSYLKAASEEGHLERVLAGLDVLGSTPWSINEDVFNVMAEVWNSGKVIGKMPPLSPQMPEPVKPDNYDTDMKARRNYISDLRSFNQYKSGIVSLRSSTNYKLEIARAFLHEKFYFPHNMDFRGRAYPMSPHLNHIGDDLCRGLLKFHDAKRLGKTGLRWLRVHLANVFGYDKVSFEEREQFAIAHEEDIRKSVSDPVGEGSWWQTADDPWQALATCFELNNALNHPEGPENYMSNLPVHQDGTCNGLQHYAALGGDLAGAHQVNLSSGDRPSDVYTGVAELVIRDLEIDAAKGDAVAALLRGKVTRKVVKQTVMTTVYGVTYVGARDQVMKKLRDIAPEMSKKELWDASGYLARKILASIGNLFEGAQAIQMWLRESARLIARSIPSSRLDDLARGQEWQNRTRKINAQRLADEQMTSVIWTSPLGLPIVQPYRKSNAMQVDTMMQTVTLSDPKSSTRVSAGKQSSAFPPNFIHSLDATHMFLTALECQSAELTFASVHDSYWTHACDVDTMSDIIRDTFARLHASDVMRNLRLEFLKRYEDHYIPIKAVDAWRARQLKLNTKAATGKKEDPSSESGLTENDAKTTSEQAFSTESIDALSRDADEIAAEEEDPDVDISSPTPEEESKRALFVPLSEVLPEIPQKGTFDVNDIRRSLYFFS